MITVRVTVQHQTLQVCQFLAVTKGLFLVRRKGVDPNSLHAMEIVLAHRLIEKIGDPRMRGIVVGVFEIAWRAILMRIIYPHTTQLVEVFDRLPLILCASDPAAQSDTNYREGE